jgi:hypothetical protein
VQFMQNFHIMERTKILVIQVNDNPYWTMTCEHHCYKVCGSWWKSH